MTLGRRFSNWDKRRHQLGSPKEKARPITTATIVRKATQMSRRVMRRGSGDQNILPERFQSRFLSPGMPGDGVEILSCGRGLMGGDAALLDKPLKGAPEGGPLGQPKTCIVTAPGSPERSR